VSTTPTLDHQEPYITNSESNNISVIDTANNTVTTIPASPLAVAPDGHRVYIANAFANNVSVMEIGTG
jgi:YVTN family beta-propeller protein